MKRRRVLLLNLSCIGSRSTSKMAAQSYSQGINQVKWISQLPFILLSVFPFWRSNYNRNSRGKILQITCNDAPRVDVARGWHITTEKGYESTVKQLLQLATGREKMYEKKKCKG